MSERQAFDLLAMLAGDEEMAGVFSREASVVGWLRTEVALAGAEAEVGVIDHAAAAAIEEHARVELIDLDRLWVESRNVGYPILPLVRQLDALLPPEHQGTAHYGATTQDIMDTGLSLQLVEASDLLLGLLGELGDVLAASAREHAGTVMAARTHAQQAVPTTWGAKLAGYLGEITRQHARLERASRAVCYVSLFGAGGTSAAYGPHARAIRHGVAARLDMDAPDVSRHVARDNLAEWGTTAAGLTATCARLAREVIELSRNEIGEVSEKSGHLRGASSTMPQKANPITSEALVGFAAVAGALASSLYRVMEAGHDRAAGEWQIEWQVLPMLACQAASSLRGALDLATNLQVFPDAMRRNLDVDHGLVMAEAYMITLATDLGREEAHELVYAAARATREEDVSLFDAVRDRLPDARRALLPAPLSPATYLGETAQLVDSALADWAARTAPDRAQNHVKDGD